MSSDMNGFPSSNLSYIKVDPHNRSLYLENSPDVLKDVGVTTGVNFRAYKYGAFAIDLQSFRTASTQSASGDHSVAIGIRNTASGVSSTCIGRQNTVTGGTGAIALGFNNTCSGATSCSLGSGNNSAADNATSIGLNNTTSASAATCIGSSCFASGVNSTAMGLQSSTFSVLGRFSYSSGVFASLGDCQLGLFVVRGATTDATPKVLSTDAGTATASNTVVLSNNSCYAFKGQIVVKESATGQASAWNIEGMITRVANAAATTLVASTVTAISNATAIPGPALTADTTLGGLAVTCTGVAATNLRWSCTIQTTEIVYT